MYPLATVSHWGYQLGTLTAPLVPAEPREDGRRLVSEHRVLRQSLDDQSALSRADPVTDPVDRAQEVGATLP
jgi:hypothetical protein